MTGVCLSNEVQRERPYLCSIPQVKLLFEIIFGKLYQSPDVMTVWKNSASGLRLTLMILLILLFSLLVLAQHPANPVLLNQGSSPQQLQKDGEHRVNNSMQLLGRSLPAGTCNADTPCTDASCCDIK